MLRLSIFSIPVALFCAGAAQAQITNQDNCANSGMDVVGPGGHAYDNSLATTGTQGQNEAGCYAFGTSGIDNDIWFTFQAASTSPVVIETCGAVDDSKLAAWPSTAACPLDGTSLACNDDTCGLQSRISFAATAGTSYIVQVGNFPSAAPTGPNQITITEVPTNPNDECANAIGVNAPGAYAFDTTGSSTSAPAWPCTTAANDIWFRFIAPNTSNYSFDTCTGTAYDSTLEVFSGPCGALTSISCNDDACATQSLVTAATTAGTSYYVRIGGYTGQTGAGILTISEFFGNPPLSNQDECANAAVDTIGAGTYDWDNSLATTGLEGQNEALCYAFGTSGIQSDVWAVYTVGASGSTTIETCNSVGSNVDTRLAAYPLAPCSMIDGTSIACSDDDCGTGFLSSITFNAGCGESYLVQLGSFPGSADGTAQLFITESGPGCGPGPIGQQAMCSPVIPNSTGATAEMAAFGLVNLAAQDVRLSVDNVPVGQFGIFFTSTTLGFIMNPGGSIGNICVVGNQGRYNQIPQIFTGAGGNSPVPPGGLQVGNIPVPVNPTIPAFTAETWYFQAWFRDIGGTNNFSDTLQITFVP